MRRVIASLLLVQAACSVSVPIPEGELDEIAREVSKVGHPAARYEGARLAKLATATDSRPAYVDIEIDYVAVLAKKTQTMTVRFEVQSLDPCKVRTDVVGDTGKTRPVLLDNAVASPLVGQRICAAFGAEGSRG